MSEASATASARSPEGQGNIFLSPSGSACLRLLCSSPRKLSVQARSWSVDAGISVYKAPDEEETRPLAGSVRTAQNTAKKAFSVPRYEGSSNVLPTFTMVLSLWGAARYSRYAYLNF